MVAFFFFLFSFFFFERIPQQVSLGSSAACGCHLGIRSSCVTRQEKLPLLLVGQV